MSATVKYAGGGGGGVTLIQKPTVTVGTYTYNRSAQGPTITWATDTEDKCIVTNATKTNAGTYTLTIALKNTQKYVWNDGTTADLTYEYTIQKANQTITLSSNAVTLNSEHLTSTVTVSGAHGTISVTSSNTSIATATVSGSAVTISNVSKTSGNATITVSAAGTTNYNATSATVAVKASFLKIVTFSGGTDEEIKAMLDAYYADEITWAEMGWNVGDTRLIHFNSMTAPKPWQSKTWSAQDITVTIIGHDQNILATPVNGHTKGCITVQVRECLNNSSTMIGQMSDSDSDGHIGVIDHYQYGNVPFTKWSELYIRSYMNSTLLDAIPSGDFKSAIKSSKHYRHIDNTTTTAEQVTDTLFLPSIPEYVGTSAVNAYTPTSPTEGTQFPYYKTASNRIKYGNNAGSSNGVTQYYWTGSATIYFSTYTGAGWCAVNSTGNGYMQEQFYGMGLAPAWVM